MTHKLPEVPDWERIATQEVMDKYGIPEKDRHDLPGSELFQEIIQNHKSRMSTKLREEEQADMQRPQPDARDRKHSGMDVSEDTFEAACKDHLASTSAAMCEEETAALACRKAHHSAGPTEALDGKDTGAQNLADLDEDTFEAVRKRVLSHTSALMRQEEKDLECGSGRNSR